MCAAGGEGWGRSVDVLAYILQVKAFNISTKYFWVIDAWSTVKAAK